VEDAGDLEVIILRARPPAQGLEIEPDHAPGTATRPDLAGLDVQNRVTIVGIGQPVEGTAHLGVGVGAAGNVVQAHLLHHTAPVIRTLADRHHLQPVLEQFNGRQDAAAVQAIGIQGIRMEVGRGDEPDTLLEQRTEQAVQDHGIRDVGDMELVETQEAVFARHLPGQHVQRIDGALQQRQLAVHLAHELMEMQAGLALHRDRAEKTIHEKALAAPDTTVHVHAARNRRAVDKLFPGAGALPAVAGPICRAPVERSHHGQLPGVRLKRPLLQLAMVGFEDRRHARQPITGSRTAPPT